MAWLTVLLGTGVLAGNTVELGGVGVAAREWTAWLLAALVILHGISLAWGFGRDEETAGLRLPRWPLAALPIVLWLGYAWWGEQTNPGAARETFFLAVEAWLLTWVVAATPGGRALSWAWLVMIGSVALLPLIAAIGWQLAKGGLWLPMARELPIEWRGRWSGTLPLSGAFGGLMVLAAPALLVMAFSRRSPAIWRILCGYGGLMLLFGAMQSRSLGAWAGVAFILVMLPVVVGRTRGIRLLGWGMGLAFLTGFALLFLRHGGISAALLQSGEPPYADTSTAINAAWQTDPWLGGHGASITNLIFNADGAGPAGGWRYGFSDWTELAAVWGLLGLGYALAVLGGLLAAAWSSWAKLPFLVSSDASLGAAPSDGEKNPLTYSFTPETKILLAAGALGVSAFAVAMSVSRTLTVPAVVFAFAVMAGVLARNVPQRGGSWRLQPMTRRILSLGLAALVAYGLIAKVASLIRAQGEVDFAAHVIEQMAQESGSSPRQAGLWQEAEDRLHQALVADPGNARGWTNLAWLELEQARLDPIQFDAGSQKAEDAARRAVDLAPLAASSWLVRGLACLLNNRVALADNYIRKGLDLAPHDPQLQYYAVAVFALDPARRPGAQRLIQTIPASAAEHRQRLQAVFNWASASTVPLEGLRQRPLPPPYFSPPPWPPLDGFPAGTAPSNPRF